MTILTDCRDWRGERDLDGYAITAEYGKPVRANRVVYMEHHGLEPNEMENYSIIMKCRNRNCINPEHMVHMTHQDAYEHNLAIEEASQSGEDRMRVARALRDEGVYIEDIAAGFGVHPDDMTAEFDAVEEWRDIVGFEALYEVSDRGRVRNFNTGRVLSDKPSDTGYSLVVLRKDGEGHPRRIHRLVAESFLGVQPIGTHVCHKDNNPENNRLENLRYDTPKGNQSDRRPSGVQANRNKALDNE